MKGIHPQLLQTTAAIKTIFFIYAKKLCFKNLLIYFLNLIILYGHLIISDDHLYIPTENQTGIPPG